MSVISRRRCVRCLIALALVASASVGMVRPAEADDVILSGMTWMTGYPSTWNAAAPKYAFDGLHFYAVLCGYAGAQNSCSVARRRGAEPWTHPGRVFQSDQPPVTIIDRRGRLNVFYNNPTVRHIRFDNPSVDLVNAIDLPLGVVVGVSYLHASYDAATDAIFLAGNESANYTLYISVNVGGAGWSPPAAMPGPNPASMYLYARTLYARGHYYVLAGEHPRGGSNASYTATVVFESPTPTGPWRAHDLWRAKGAKSACRRELGRPDRPEGGSRRPCPRARSHRRDRQRAARSRRRAAHRPRRGRLRAPSRRSRHRRWLCDADSSVRDTSGICVDSLGSDLPGSRQARRLSQRRWWGELAAAEGHRLRERTEPVAPRPWQRLDADPGRRAVHLFGAAPVALHAGHVRPCHAGPGGNGTYETSQLRADGAEVRARTYSDPATSRSYRYEQITHPDRSVTITSNTSRQAIRRSTPPIRAARFTTAIPTDTNGPRAAGDSARATTSTRQPMNVAIIGASGFIGTALVKNLAAAGVQCAALSSATGAFDLDIGLLVDAALPGMTLDGVVYLSQSPRYRDVPQHAPHLWGVNVQSALKAAEWASRCGARRFVYTSTGNVYASSFAPLREDAPLRRDSWYALSKVQAEEALALHQRELSVTCARLFGVYGPRQSGKLVPNSLTRSVRGGRFGCSGTRPMRPMMAAFVSPSPTSTTSSPCCITS